MNTQELSILMNVPREEVSGITLRSIPRFGVNYVPEGDEIRLGKIFHKGGELDRWFGIPPEQLTKHGFICGVTGAGKTNTCMHLLKASGQTFLVIEPAKTEYRQLLKHLPDLRVFTLGRETISPFRINPFEFIRGTELLSHIDYLKAVFNAAFPMYASMPYLLEEAIYEIYLDKGWILATSQNQYFPDDAPDEVFYDYLPTLQDLLDKIDVVVQSKHYAQQLTMDLSAALKARLSSLVQGGKGYLLNVRRSTPWEELFNSQVVLELRALGDDDEKCFLMGLLFAMLYEYRQQHHDASGKLKHVTLIEEAHRLLRHVPLHVSMEAANSRGKAVETFTNILAEIREYGESILIVDQIPAKLSPDVVKNTSLKIVHRLLAQDDREFVGSTMLLTEEQKLELPLLKVGRVVAHREGLDKAFLLQIPATKGTDSEGNADPHPVRDEQVSERMRAWRRGRADLAAPHIRGFSGRLAWLSDAEALNQAYMRRDVRRFENSLYRALIGTVLLWLSDEDGLEPVTMREALHGHELLTAQSVPERASLWLWYGNRLFSELERRYPGRFDQYLRARKAWFALYGTDEPPEATRAALRDALGRMVAPETDCRPPLLRCYAEESRLGDRLAGWTTASDDVHNDALMEQAIKNLLPLPCGQATLTSLKLSLLSVLLEDQKVGNPSNILDRYRNFMESV